MTNITLLCANRPLLLKQALDSIGDLSDATVTIRDAGMNDEVYKLARTWCDSVPRSVCYSRPRKIGTGPSRNDVIYGSSSAFGRGDYLYISDDDVRWLYTNWLDLLIEAYKDARDQGYRVLGAYNHPFNQPVSWGRGRRIYECYAVASQSMLMDWETWDEFGPFCDTPAGKVCQSEDVDFCNRIRSAGYKVGVISPALLVNTGITNSFGEHIPGWELVKSQAQEGIVVE